MRTAIIGAGKMGVWFAKFCREKGDHVIVADRKKERLVELPTELAAEATTNFAKAIQSADNILICVSISAFEEVIKKISSSIREDQVVMDICSIKDFPVKVMHKHIKAGLVLGTHPVFGPGSTGIKHKTFILTPTNAKEREFAENYKRWLEKEQAHVFIMSPKKHDELMSVVLGLPHFLGLVACDTLLEQADFGQTKKVAGTTYRMLLTLAEATALETPDLYASLQTTLPELGKIEDLFIAKAQEWLDLIKKRDSKAIIARMDRLKTSLTNADRDFAKSYEIMYKMLEASES